MGFMIQARSPELKRNLIAVLLARSTNLGLTRMTEAVLEDSIGTASGYDAPASTIIPVPRLAEETALFEIDAIAMVHEPVSTA